MNWFFFVCVYKHPISILSWHILNYLHSWKFFWEKNCSLFLCAESVTKNTYFIDQTSQELKIISIFSYLSRILLADDGSLTRSLVQFSNYWMFSFSSSKWKFTIFTNFRVPCRRPIFNSIDLRLLDCFYFFTFSLFVFEIFRWLPTFYGRIGFYFLHPHLAGSWWMKLFFCSVGSIHSLKSPMNSCFNQKMYSSKMRTHEVTRQMPNFILSK